MGIKIKVLFGLVLLFGIVYLVYGQKIIYSNYNLSPDSAENEGILSEETVDAGQFEIKLLKDENGEIQATTFIPQINIPEEINEENKLEIKNNNKEFVNLATRNVPKTITCNPLTPLATPTTPSHIQVPSFDRMEHKGRYFVFTELQSGNQGVVLRGYDFGPDEKYGTNDDVGVTTLDSNIRQFTELINPVVNDLGEVVYTKLMNVTGPCNTWTKEQVKCQFGPGATCQNTLVSIKSLTYGVYNNVCLEPQFVGRSITHGKLAYTYSTYAQGTLPQIFMIETYNLTSGATQVITKYTGPWGYNLVMPFEIMISNSSDFVFWRMINAFMLTPYYVDSYASLSGVTQPVNIDLQQDIRGGVGLPRADNQFGAGIFYFDKALQKYLYIASTRNPSNLNYLSIYYRLFSLQGVLVNGGTINSLVQNEHQFFPLVAFSPRLNSYLLSFNKISTTPQSFIELYLYDYSTNTFKQHTTIANQFQLLTTPQYIAQHLNTFNYPNLMTSVTEIPTGATSPTLRIYGTTCS